MTGPSKFLWLTAIATASLVGQAIGQQAITEQGTWIVNKNEAVQQWDPNSGTYIWVGEDSYMHFASSGDTVINAQTYKKLVGHSVEYDGVSSFNSSYPPYFYLAYRNDNAGKAFRVMPGNSTEELWYDFSKNVGDTIHTDAVPVALEQSSQYVVTHQNEVTLCDSTYNRFYYNGPVGQVTYTNLIEGVGAPNNFIQHNPNPMEWDTLMFFCGQVLALGGITVENQSTSINSTPEKLEVSVWPNPATKTLSIAWSATNNIGQFRIVDVHGRTVISQSSTANPMQVDVSSLASGRYFVASPDASLVSFQKQ